MTEGNPKPIRPSEGNTGPAPELPLREVHKLPSNAILDGIYAGRIHNPEALRAYVLRQRTEFLQAHPDRSDEPDAPSEIGRWHRLVYSDTADEYSGLAALADSEVHRRTAVLPGPQLAEPSHLQGVANFRRMAEAWRQRAAHLTDTEPEPQSAPKPLNTTVSTTPAISHLTVEQQIRPEKPDYASLQYYEILDGINNGELTETEAVHVYIRKSLESVRELYEGEERSEMEAEYAEVIYGEPQGMIRFCLSRATEHMGSGAPAEAVSPANYKIAARWYAMAGRFAQEAAQSRGEEDSETTEEP
jgi:hypothetical protein